DEPLKEDSEATLVTMLPSREPSIDDKLADEEISNLLKEKMSEFARTMEKRDLDILENRILSETPKSLNKIGKTYGISKERVRQLEGNIIKRLRDYFKREIKDFDALKPY
ncbi:MAG: sigma factor-like helix-turn-helix DNA-binding protein, partial [Thermodesulfobacteriota bacterium]